jgi:Tfp pilus assembly protein PilN
MSSMRPLSLNHQASKREVHRRPLNALLLAGLACNIAGGLYYAELGNQRQAAEYLAAQPSAKRSVQNPRAAETLQAELVRANDTVRALSLPWDDVFGALEAASIADVSLLALDPMPDKKMLKLRAEARNMEAVLEYLRALAGNAVFSAVSLQSHQVQQADPHHPVRFLVLLEWRTQS